MEHLKKVETYIVESSSTIPDAAREMIKYATKHPDVEVMLSLGRGMPTVHIEAASSERDIVEVYRQAAEEQMKHRRQSISRGIDGRS